ncbi:hypothetical protein J6590_041934 [Homalodisca vitripennis]|nr:hypothetical protein J6590_041934 [Homalodisca vitripennis]
MKFKYPCPDPRYSQNMRAERLRNKFRRKSAFGGRLHVLCSSLREQNVNNQAWGGFDETGVPSLLARAGEVSNMGSPGEMVNINIEGFQHIETPTRRFLCRTRGPTSE